MERFTEFDFGITEIASMFNLDVRIEEGFEDIVRSRFDLEGLEADEDDVAGMRCVVAAVEKDASDLIASALSDEQFVALWTAMIGHAFGFEARELTGRGLMERIRLCCREFVDVYGPGRVDSAPEWNSPAARDTVLAVLRDTDFGSLPLRYLGAGFDAVAMRSGLEAVVKSVSAELGFRLLLRAVTGNLLRMAPELWARYRALFDTFSYGAEMLPLYDLVLEA